MLTRTIAGAAALGAVVAAAACIEPPPKITAIPPGGLSLRLHVFGASAQDTRQAFEAARQTNKNFFLVREGGDGEVLIGLENDSPKCAPPAALCSYKVAVRVRDNEGKVVYAANTTASANAERCGSLCDQAINGLVVKVVETAVAALKSGSPKEDGSAPELGDGGVAEDDSDLDGGADAGRTTVASASAGSKAPSKKNAAKPDAAVEAGPEPLICDVARGPSLPSDEAERRAAQVEVLKRIGVLDEEEYDCLRKAYLERL